MLAAALNAFTVYLTFWRHRRRDCAQGGSWRWPGTGADDRAANRRAAPRVRSACQDLAPPGPGGRGRQGTADRTGEARRLAARPAPAGPVRAAHAEVWEPVGHAPALARADRAPALARADRAPALVRADRAPALARADRAAGPARVARAAALARAARGAGVARADRAAALVRADRPDGLVRAARAAGPGRVARAAAPERVARGAVAGQAVQVQTAVRLPADPRRAAAGRAALAALRAEGAEAAPAAAAQTAPLVQAVRAVGPPTAGTAAPAGTTLAGVPNPGLGGSRQPVEPAGLETSRTGAADQPDPAPHHEVAAASKARADPEPAAGRAAKDHGPAQRPRRGPGKSRLLVPGRRPHRGLRKRQVRVPARHRQRGPGKLRVGGLVRIGRPERGDPRNRGPMMRQGCGLRGRQRRHVLGERRGHAPQPARTRGAPPERAGRRRAASALRTRGAPPERAGRRLAASALLATGGQRFRQASPPTSWTPRRERSSERCLGTWPTPWLSGS